jgi:hypothetical protein
MNRLRKNLCYGLHGADDIMHVSVTVIEERDRRRGCKQSTCKMTQSLLIRGCREMKQKETSNK